MEYLNYTINEYQDKPKNRTMYSVTFSDAIHVSTLHAADINVIKEYIHQHILNSSEFDKRRQIEEQAIDSFYKK